jgi:Nif-specific regulatory protein
MSTLNGITHGQLQTLFEVSREINSNLHLAEVLERILDLAIQVLNADKGLVLLRGDSGKLEQRAARAIDDQAIDEVVAMSSSIVERVGTGGEPIFLRGTPERDRAERTIEG